MNNNLKHTGVIGMKWGVRRQRTPSHQDYTSVRELKKKKLRELSNDELSRMNRRMDLEKRYKDLNPTIIQRGARIAGNILKRKETLVVLARAIKVGVALVGAANSKQRPVGVPHTPHPTPEIKVVGP